MFWIGILWVEWRRENLDNKTALYLQNIQNKFMWVHANKNNKALNKQYLKICRRSVRLLIDTGKAVEITVVLVELWHSICQVSIAESAINPKPCVHPQLNLQTETPHDQILREITILCSLTTASKCHCPTWPVVWKMPCLLKQNIQLWKTTLK